jgi:toxin CcdB
MNTLLCNGAIRCASQQGALRDSIPFVVVVQSAQFDRYRRRVVVPRVRQTLLPRGTPILGARMNPVFAVQRVRVVFHPLDMVSVALDQLGGKVGVTQMRDKSLQMRWTKC